MLLQPKISIGGQNVLIAGNVVAYGYQNIDIFPIANTPYHIRFIFQTAPNVMASVNTIQAPNQTQLHLVNFDVPQGMGTSAPIFVANWMGAGLYISFVVHTLGPAPTATRVVHYTITQGATLGV